MPMGIVGKEELAREVAAALGDCTPTQAYEQAHEFRADLHAYLDARLNPGAGQILDTGCNFCVQRASRKLNCDYVLSELVRVTL